jgi:hypothetical protein
MQDLIRRYDGVVSTRVGYTGGEVPNATYRDHGIHAEAIEITFDPSRISYRKLLEFFFQTHDPTTLNRQDNDVGATYRSAIFYTSDEQRRIAEEIARRIFSILRIPRVGPSHTVKPGLYVVRLKVPGGAKVMPHTHPEEVRTLTEEQQGDCAMRRNVWNCHSTLPRQAKADANPPSLCRAAP